MDEFKSIADRLKADPLAKQAEQEVIAKYGELFKPKNINNLTTEDFKSFLLFKNNHHWSGIFRTENLVTIDMARLREAIRILLDESQPLEKRLDVLFPPNKPNYIKGMGKAIATPILLVVYPDKYGVWNEPSQKGLKQLGLLPEFGRGACRAGDSDPRDSRGGGPEQDLRNYGSGTTGAIRRLPRRDTSARH